LTVIVQAGAAWTDSSNGYSVIAELNAYIVEDGQMSTETFEKQPADIEDVDVSFVDWLARRGDSIASAGDVAVTADTGIHHTIPPVERHREGMARRWHGCRALQGHDHGDYSGGRVKQVEHYMRVKEH
jgi:hypothetical protein